MNILPQLLVNGLITGSIYALASIGFSLSFGLIRIFNFAHGQLMMVGAFAFYFLNQSLGWSFSLAAIGTLGIVGIVAILSFHLFIAPFYRINFLLPIVTTIALATILEALVSMSFGVHVRSIPTSFSQPTLEFGSISITIVEMIIVLTALVLLSSAAFFIHSTGIGRKIRALAQHSEGAESLAVDERDYKLGVYIAGVLFAAIAGVAVGYQTNLVPTMGNAYTIKAFAALILGGMGNIWGTVFGAYFLGMIENLALGLDFGDYSVPPGYRDAFAFFIIFAVLLVRPEGLFRSKLRKA